MLIRFLIISSLLAIPLAATSSVEIARPQCVDGPLPPHPERCQNLLGSLLTLGWTREVKTYTEAHVPDRIGIPKRCRSLGCQVGVWPVQHNSAATFAMQTYVNLIEEMINVCVIERGKVGRWVIPGTNGGVILGVGGYSAFPPVGVGMIGMNETA